MPQIDIRKRAGKQFFYAFSATGIENIYGIVPPFTKGFPYNLPKGAGGGLVFRKNRLCGESSCGKRGNRQGVAPDPQNGRGTSGPFRNLPDRRTGRRHPDHPGKPPPGRRPDHLRGRRWNAQRGGQRLLRRKRPLSGRTPSSDSSPTEPVATSAGPCPFRPAWRPP